MSLRTLAPIFESNSRGCLFSQLLVSFCNYAKVTMFWCSFIVVAKFQSYSRFCAFMSLRTLPMFESNSRCCLFSQLLVSLRNNANVAMFWCSFIVVAKVPKLLLRCSVLFHCCQSSKLLERLRKQLPWYSKWFKLNVKEF